MATQIPDSSLLLGEFASRLLGEREVGPRARVISARVAQLVAGAAVVVYVVEDQTAPEWTPKSILGDVKISHNKVDYYEGTLGELAKSREPFACEPSALTREDYSHLDIRRTVLSLAYVPLITNEVLVGAIEVIS